MIRRSAWVTKNVSAPQMSAVHFRRTVATARSYATPTLCKGSNAAIFPNCWARLLARRNFTTDDSGFHDDFKTLRKKYETAASASGNQSPESVQHFIKQQIESHPVVIFMKGTPDAPRCGFSRLAVSLLQEEGVTDIHGIDVLQDNNVREGVKQFTKWPTLPQVFINKEFVGGADIIKSMFESGELKETLKKGGVKLTPPV